MIMQIPGYHAAPLVLADDEIIVCRNATIIAKKSGEFSGWIDNSQPITIIYNEGEENCQELTM